MSLKPPAPSGVRDPEHFRKQLEERFKDLKPEDLQKSILTANELGGQSWPWVGDAIRLLDGLNRVGKAVRENDMEDLAVALEVVDEINREHPIAKSGHRHLDKMRYGSLTPAELEALKVDGSRSLQIDGGSPESPTPSLARSPPVNTPLGSSQRSKSRSSTLRGALTRESSLVKEQEEEKERLREEERKAEVEELNAKWEKLTSEEKVKKGLIREKVEAELIQTESTYVQNLLIILHSFVLPLKQQDLNLTDKQKEILLGNFETLVPFHTRFFSTLEEKKTSIAKVFDVYAVYFKMYMDYLRNYAELLSTFVELQGNKKFQTFLVKLRESLMKHGQLDLMSYLIMPVQRVPRYVLLLREIRANTDPTHADFTEIDSVLVRTKGVTGEINEKKKAMEQLSKLVDLQNRITELGSFSLVIPHRRVLRVGDVSEIVLKSGIFSSIKFQQRVLYLFNDALLLINEKSQHTGHMQLAAVSELEDYQEQQNAVCLASASEVFYLKFKNTEEKDSWVKELQVAISHAKVHRGKGAGMRNLRMQKRLAASGERGYEQKLALHKRVADGIVEIKAQEEERQEQVDQAYAKHEKMIAERAQLLRDHLANLNLHQAGDETDDEDEPSTPKGERTPRSSSNFGLSPTSPASAGGAAGGNGFRVRQMAPRTRPSPAERSQDGTPRASVASIAVTTFCSCEKATKERPCTVHPYASE